MKVPSACIGSLGRREVRIADWFPNALPKESEVSFHVIIVIIVVVLLYSSFFITIIQLVIIVTMFAWLHTFINPCSQHPEAVGAQRQLLHKSLQWWPLNEDIRGLKLLDDHFMEF